MSGVSGDGGRTFSGGRGFSAKPRLTDTGDSWGSDSQQGSRGGGGYSNGMHIELFAFAFG